MKIYVDSREKPQAIKGILAYFERNGIEIERTALKTGDYMLEGQPNLIVDRKQSLAEMAHNLLSADRARFYREVRRARADGIRLIILCEHGPDVKTFDEVKKWVPKYGKVSGKAIADAIFRLEISYGVPTFFCSKRSTGKRIIELLTQETTDE